MAALNSPCFMLKTFVAFFMAIVFGALCKANIIRDKSFKSLCDSTPYPETCYHSLVFFPQDTGNDNDVLHFYHHSIQASINEVSRLYNDFGENGSLTRMLKDIDKSLQLEIESCNSLLSLALFNLNLSSMHAQNSVSKHETFVDIRTWICAALADLDTCIYSFEYAPEKARRIVVENLDNSNRIVSNSLSIISKIDDLDRRGVGSRKSRNDWPPSWLSYEDRERLYGSKQAMKADVVVAKDGSGDYQTINEAIKVVPENSMKRFVIHVNEGIYQENVRIDQNKWNITMFGDGMNKTIVTGNLSNGSGGSTSTSATFAVSGNGFIAKDMGFQNTAGPTMGQAVALLSYSDRSIFYRCSIDGYQDTLYAHSNRQFYRECLIYGTVDFIFGGSATVIQNCTILAKKPLKGQANSITAQAKSDPQCMSGFSIQNCTVVAAEDLGGARTFLGRPWRNLSTTIVMESFLDSLIDPEGWLSWIPNVTPPDTIYYAEYNNTGPGSVTSQRVTWKGVRVNITADEAKNFTVREFLAGDEWIPQTDIPFQPDL